VNKSFQAKHVRLKAYMDEVLMVIHTFTDFKISYIPREMNELADSLAVSACAFIPLLVPNSSLCEQIMSAYMPSWALLGMTAVK
jgi:hypothetical protein